MLDGLHFESLAAATQFTKSRDRISNILQERRASRLAAIAAARLYLVMYKPWQYGRCLWVQLAPRARRARARNRRTEIRHQKK